MEQKNSRIGEVIRFLVAGGCCFAIELGLFALLNRGLGWGTVVSTSAAFLISTVVNYVLCMLWVFPGNKNSGNAAKAAFLISSLIGWLLNVLLMLLFAALWGEETVLFTFAGYGINIILLNKCLATMLVMVWNYLTKRKIVYWKTKQ